MAWKTEEQEMLRTTHGTFPLEDYHLVLTGRRWRILHTGVVLTHADESRFFRELLPRLPYGVALWPASIALAHELAARSGQLAGRSLLELGSGTGLPGIVAASLGARVTQTDRHELAMAVCRRNGERNEIGGIEHALVDWTEWKESGRHDWIIGSDILYGDAMHPHLTRIFRSCLLPGGRVLLADPLRAPSLKFLEVLQEGGWGVAMTKWTLGDDRQPRVFGVFELTPPP